MAQRLGHASALVWKTQTARQGDPDTTATPLEVQLRLHLPTFTLLNLCIRVTIDLSPFVRQSCEEVRFQFPSQFLSMRSSSIDPEHHRQLSFCSLKKRLPLFLSHDSLLLVVRLKSLITKLGILQPLTLFAEAIRSLLPKISLQRLSA